MVERAHSGSPLLFGRLAVLAAITTCPPSPRGSGAGPLIRRNIVAVRLSRPFIAGHHSISVTDTSRAWHHDRLQGLVSAGCRSSARYAARDEGLKPHFLTTLATALAAS